MKHLLLNLFMAVVWATSTKTFSLLNLATGFVISYFIIWLMHDPRDHPARAMSYPLRAWKLISFLLYFMFDLLRSTLRISYYVVSPLRRLHPAILGVPLTAKTDTQITVLANLTTLIPGTFALDISDDHRVLYVHFMKVSNLDRARNSIPQGIERKLLEVMR